MPAAPLEALRSALPPRAVVSDRDLLAGYERDITGRFSGEALALARPTAPGEVAQLLEACQRERLGLVVQGGNTGLVGGGVPGGGEVLLSTRGLDWIDSVDRDSNQVSVGAGATLEAVQRAAASAGLELPIDHGARSAATIGGMVATDAGGPLALRHGTMRRRVVGVEAVLAGGGTLRRMNGLLKDNAGYDLPQLLVGSEGTLGVITAVRLQLEPVQPFRVAALFGLPGLPAGLELLGRLRAVPGLEAVDFFDRACMELARDHAELRRPLPREHELYLVVQCATGEDVTEALAREVEGVVPDDAVAAAADTASRRELWAYRECLNEAIRATGIPLKLDVALPIGRLPEFEARLRDLVASHLPAARLYLYGHLGDGNVHVNLVGLDLDDDRGEELILEAAAELGGTISAEHGIGRAKRRYLGLCRSPAEIEAMQAIKAALDPAGSLGPGCVLPN